MANVPAQATIETTLETVHDLPNLPIPLTKLSCDGLVLFASYYQLAAQLSADVDPLGFNVMLCATVERHRSTLAINLVCPDETMICVHHIETSDAGAPLPSEMGLRAVIMATSLTTRHVRSAVERILSIGKGV